MRSRRSRPVAGVLVGCLALTGCTGASEPSAGPSVATSADSAPPEPGPAGIGDSYFPTYGNGGYDVDHYTLKIRYDPPTDRLTGDVVIRARATIGLSRFNLDFTGLPTSDVRVNGQSATARQEKAELVITPAGAIPAGSEFTVDIDYAGIPKPVAGAGLGEGGFLHTEDGAIALGQPESASTWFPVNDHPLDKATYDMEISVPEGLSALSNGAPKGSTTAGGWTTWKWSEDKPMASYLATMLIGKYRVKTGTHRGKPIVTAVAAALPAGGNADRAIARTAEITDFLETQFGPYPFASYGGVVVGDERIRYALETQSRPVYGPSFFSVPDALWVVAHELAHQWFGDSVSIASWQHIWLNEGFASYAEWLWSEHDAGVPVAESFQRQYAATEWSVPTGDPGVENLFSSAVYQRGAMVVQALRLAVGDADFFAILKAWTTEKRYGNAVTEDFIALAERVSGEKLREVFDAWLFGTTPPPIPG